VNLKHILLAVTVAMVAMAGLVVLRHYVPPVRAVFQAIGVDGHITWVETQVLNAISGNPAGILGIFGAVATTGITIITKLFSKLSSIRKAASERIDQVQGNAQQIVSTVKGQADEEARKLLETIQAQKNQLSMMQGEKKQFDKILVAEQQKVLAANTALQEQKQTVANLQIHVAELKLQLEKTKVPTLH